MDPGSVSLYNFSSNQEAPEEEMADGNQQVENEAAEANTANKAGDNLQRESAVQPEGKQPIEENVGGNRVE